MLTSVFKLNEVVVFLLLEFVFPVNLRKNKLSKFDVFASNVSSQIVTHCNSKELHISQINTSIL